MVHHSEPKDLRLENNASLILLPAGGATAALLPARSPANNGSLLGVAAGPAPLGPAAPRPVLPELQRPGPVGISIKQTGSDKRTLFSSYSMLAANSG